MDRISSFPSPGKLCIFYHGFLAEIISLDFCCWGESFVWFFEGCFHKTWKNSAFEGDGGILARLPNMVEMNFLVVGGE